MAINLDKKLRNEKQTGFIQKTFVEHRDRLLDYARSYYGDQIKDFSETSLGGMFLDFAALVGDSMTYYIDQQINELNYEKATNIQNINSHLRRAGIKASPPSPAIANITFSLVVDANNGTPSEEQLPVIKRGTILNSINNINFVLAEDVDFTDLKFTQEELDFDANNNPASFIISKKGICISGEITEESVFISGDPDRFLSYTLQNQDVTFIEKVMDSELNEYYEVEYLSQDTVYKKVKNSNDTYFEVIPAPYRFIREENFNSNITTLRFGNGNGKTLKDDILINPEDLTLPVLGRDYSSRFSLDPQKLLSSLSLGVSPAGKSLTIKYQFGGGLSHNVPSGAINEIIKNVFTFPNMKSESEVKNRLQLEIVESLSVINEERAIGGSNGLSIEELRVQIPNALKMQSRIISHKDLLARLYTMPANFGRIHKAAVIENQYTNLTKNLYIICKDEDGYYVEAKDVLKINIQKYLEEFRLIGDTFNIVDAPVVNFSINLNLKIQEGFEILDVIEETKSSLVTNLRFDALQIGEAININDIIRVCSNIQGVISIVTPIKDIISINTVNKVDEFGNLLEYNRNKINVMTNLDNGLLFPPPGGIFELKYSSKDIKIRGT